MFTVIIHRFKFVSPPFFSHFTQRWEAWTSNFWWTDTQLNVNTSILVTVLSDSNRFFIFTTDLNSAIIRQKRGKPHTTTLRKPIYLTDIFLLLWRDKIECKCWIHTTRSSLKCSVGTVHQPLSKFTKCASLCLFIYRPFTTGSAKQKSRKSCFTIQPIAYFYGKSQINEARGPTKSTCSPDSGDVPLARPLGFLMRMWPIWHLLSDPGEQFSIYTHLLSKWGYSIDFCFYTQLVINTIPQLYLSKIVLHFYNFKLKKSVLTIFMG